MIDQTLFSPWLLRRRLSEPALERIHLAKRRIQSILDTHVTAHQRTLEQKIADQGPTNQRVDPHLIGLAIKDLIELNRLKTTLHPATSSQHWYSNPGTSDEKISARLEGLAPLYASTQNNGFGNLIGDALEIAVQNSLILAATDDRRLSFLGQFDFTAPKRNGRRPKVSPPKSLSGRSTSKEFDFL